MTRVDLEQIWWAGVKAVQGEKSVATAISQHKIAAPDQIIAVGKAATSMAAAACAAFADVPTLIVTKYHHSQGAPAHATVVEAAHPLPDHASLEAGAQILNTVQNSAPDSHLLLLVSGGASALAEVLPQDMSLDILAQKTQNLLATGQEIHTMNALRTELSLIKGGKLLSHFQGTKVTTLAISDVEGDALGVIGSGIGAAPPSHRFEFSAHIVASNAIARQAVAQAQIARNTDIAIVNNEETLYADVTRLAPRIADYLKSAPAGLHIWGGEPTVILPDNPGSGGRNMALALLIAREIAGTTGIRLLVAGTDGTDGPTDAAGAIVDGQTWDPSGQKAIDTANAAPWFDAKGALFRSGPTGTNVMDVLVAVKDE